MNLNNMMVPQYTDTPSNDLCTRAKIDTGTACNYKCGFCYYKQHLNAPAMDKELIKANILDLYNKGMTEFDLSGGESSIHPDFLEIVKYASSLGKVTTLSNGYAFANYVFLKSAYICGLRGILFSLHGWDTPSHDKMVGHEGAFDLMIQAIKNVKLLRKEMGDDFELRINCTVNEYIDCREYSALILDLKPDQLNLLPMNYWEDAGTNKKIDYNLVGSRVRYIIDLIKKNSKKRQMKDLEINVRYIPLCFAKGFEQHVVGIYQHIFDKKDWNIQFYNNKSSTAKKEFTKENMFYTAFLNRNNAFSKPAGCVSCSYLLVCDGIENKLLDSHTLVPIQKQKVRDINILKRINYDS